MSTVTNAAIGTLYAHRAAVIQTIAGPALTCASGDGTMFGGDPMVAVEHGVAQLEQRGLLAQRPTGPTLEALRGSALRHLAGTAFDDVDAATIGQVATDIAVDAHRELGALLTPQRDAIARQLIEFLVAGGHRVMLGEDDVTEQLLGGVRALGEPL